MIFKKLTKLKIGDKIAIVSPSFAAPAIWPHVYELGLKRLREVFDLEPVEFPATKNLSANNAEKMDDLKNAFLDKNIKGVIASLGGDIQVTYIKYLEEYKDIFINNSKPFFGFSDNTHFCNFLWLHGIPSYYGASLFTQFAMQKEMDDYTVTYIKHAMFDDGEFEIVASEKYNDIGLEWDDRNALDKKRTYEQNIGHSWDGNNDAEGITWGGCLESIDELLRHNIQIPSLEQFENIVLMTETSEEIPGADYVGRVYRALGERGILKKVKGILVGRAKAQEFFAPKSKQERDTYKQEQIEKIIKTVRVYNPDCPIIQNMDFGHTDPQVPIPYGGKIRIDARNKKIFATF
jgi:muramoyltetrapeptide carboxypeptidase LdcA involved in peptidoglycan recycling